MHIVRNASLRTKLFGGFGGVLALTVVLGIVLLNQLGSVNAGGQYLAGNSLPTVQKIALVSTDAYASREDLQTAMSATSPALEHLVLAARQADINSVDRTLASYGSEVSNAADAAQWRVVQSEWAAYQALMARGHAVAIALGNNRAAQAALVVATRPDFNTLVAGVNRWVAINNAIATQKIHANTSTYHLAQALGIILLAITVLLGLAIAFVVSRSIKRAADTVLGRMRSLADNCIAFVAEGLESMRDGDLTRSYEPVTEPIEDPSGDELGQIATAVNEIVTKVQATLAAYNEASAQLRTVIGKVSSTAGDVGSSSHQMASTSQEAGRATGEIATAVSDVATGAERQVQLITAAQESAREVTRAVADSAEHASGTAEAAHTAREIAAEGVSAANEATEAMRAVRESSQEVTDAIRELAGKSERIGAIVHTISGIAEQTNLLALNAAIEAARAGEQGKGFAVVAEEVRKLAEEAQEAAEEISGLIGAIQGDTTRAVTVVEDSAQRTEQGASVVTRTREAFTRIGDSVEDISGRVEQIAAAAQQIAASAETMQDSITEVASVAEQSSASTEEVSASTQETSASAQEVAASAEQLAGSAEELNALVGRFKITA